MPIGLQVILFCVGIVLIVKGGDFFVDAASWMAEVSGIPKFIVGATIVSVATTLPEMIVSVMASLDGKVDMAVGNAVGSVTANTGMILAIALLFMTITAKRKQYLVKSVLLLGAAAVLLLASRGGSFKLWGSLILLCIFAVFIFENIQSAKSSMEGNEKPEFSKKDLGRNLVMFALGAAGIVIGSRFLVDSGSAIATVLGVPESIIAVTMVAIGTSLPELVTTITAIVKKQGSLSAGNILGANIIDLSLILPLCSLVSGKELPIAQQSIALDMPICLLVLAVVIIPMLIKERFYKWQGVTVLMIYGAYLVMVIR